MIDSLKVAGKEKNAKSIYIYIYIYILFFIFAFIIKYTNES